MTNHTTRRDINKIKERFWNRISKRNPDDCWEWQGGKTKDGYGKAGYQHKNVLAHRLAWELTNGPIPEGLCILHECDNPTCCNPNHLFPGTHTDNMRDMFAKKRKNTQGIKNNRAKLTERQVTEIRQRHHNGDVSRLNLATEYNVTTTTINFLLNRKTWSHIP